MTGSARRHIDPAAKQGANRCHTRRRTLSCPHCARQSVDSQFQLCGPRVRGEDGCPGKATRIVPRRTELCAGCLRVQPQTSLQQSLQQNQQHPQQQQQKA